MDFKRQPFIDDCKFLFQPVDNTFADVTKGSDIVGINGHFYRIHDVLLQISLVYKSKTLYTITNIIYIMDKSSTYYFVRYLQKGM